MNFTDELLAIRFGYGLPLPAGTPRSPIAISVGLRGPDDMAKAWPIPTLATYAPMVSKLQALRKKAKIGANVKAEEDAAKAAVVKLSSLGHRTGFARAIDTSQPFRERLITFFTDHFTANARGGISNSYLPFALVEDAIRPNIGGSFADMVTQVTLHPAMLIYLDQQVSIGPNSFIGMKWEKGLNENLARELMELHTLGVDGGYSQDDVRQLAALLTGLTVNGDFKMVFDPRRVEPGAEAVMGKNYGSDKLNAINKVLRDLALHPKTAAHIARKLAVHFLDDTPDPAVIKAMRLAFVQSKGDIPTVVLALLSHPSAQAEGALKIRQPFDFIVSSCRALGVQGAQIQTLKAGDFKRGFLHQMEMMGQKLKASPGPDGWPEEAEVWVTPPRLAARIDWAMSMPQRLTKEMPEPVALAMAALASHATPTLLTAVARAESRRDGVGIVLSSPEFNRR
jgi:uncharacterized protein (DUF1800 family)